MPIDAVVLTGGRSSRLDLFPKSELLVGEETLAHRAVRAADTAGACTIVVVGPESPIDATRNVVHVRESPAFGGPASAVAAGLAALESVGGDDLEAVLVLACDMPHVHRAVSALLRALAGSPESDGTVAIDGEGRLQPLAAVYRAGALRREIRRFTDAVQGDSLSGMSMFRLIARMRLVHVEVPDGATADIDTWDDARRLGAVRPAVPADPMDLAADLLARRQTTYHQSLNREAQQS